MKNDERKDEDMTEVGEYPEFETTIQEGVDPPSDEVELPEAGAMPPHGDGSFHEDGLPESEGADAAGAVEEEWEEGEDDPIVELEDTVRKEIEGLRAELARVQDQHLRLAADFENYRKRANADLASGWVRAQAEFAGSLLEGLDDLQRVSQFTTEDATLDTLIEGVDLVERKFLKALTGAGLEAFVPTGEPFDPNTMEAMMRVHTEEEGQEGTVHQVFQKGYKFREQLVRPARVSVYSDDD